MGVRLSYAAGVVRVLTSRLRSVESTFPGWLDQFFAAVDPLYPPPAGFVKQPPTATPPARIRLEKAASASTSAPNNGSAASAPVLWTEDARWARLVKNERVTAPGWYQDVREVELEIEGVEENERTRLSVIHSLT